MIRSIMIVEIAGRPPEHIKDILSKHVGMLNNVKDLKVNSIKVHDSKKIEGSPDVYTCFAEVDFDAPNFVRLAETVFDFMPSSIEVIEPSKISMDVVEATNLLNSISGKLHRYDEIAKMAQFKIHELAAQLESAKKNQENTPEPIKEKESKPSKKKKKKK